MPAAKQHENDDRDNGEHFKVSFDEDAGREAPLSGKWRPIYIKPDSDNLILSDDDEEETGLSTRPARSLPLICKSWV